MLLTRKNVIMIRFVNLCSKRYKENGVCRVETGRSDGLSFWQILGSLELRVTSSLDQTEHLQGVFRFSQSCAVSNTVSNMTRIYNIEKNA